jgi:glycosyltransferase involved in cell wall biosynthesis
MTRRVLNVIETLGLGGAERLLVTTHRHLDRCFVESEVACLFGPNPLAGELREAGVRVHELELRGPRDVTAGVLPLRRLIGGGRFDVVHTHLYYANLVGRLAAWGRAKVVSTLHNPDYTYESQPGAVFAAKKLADRLTGRWMTRRLLAVSDEVRRDFEKQLGFSGIEVIPNYIDLDRFTRRLDQVDRATARARCGVGPDDVMVLHVGRLHPQKGQDLLIDAIARARRDVPRLALFLVGEGGSRAALEGRARDRGIGAEVRFERAQREVSVYYRAADMFAFPSRYEAFGIALLEAMAAGLPIVASRTGGIPDVTGDMAALLIPVGDVDALSDGIRGLAGDAVWRGAMGGAGRERAKAFDVKVHLPRLEAIYASL